MTDLLDNICQWCQTYWVWWSRFWYNSSTNYEEIWDQESRQNSSLSKHEDNLKLSTTENSSIKKAVYLAVAKTIWDEKLLFSININDFWSKDHWWSDQKWIICSKISRTDWQSAILDHLYKIRYSICNQLLEMLQQCTHATMLTDSIAFIMIFSWHDRL